MDRKALESTAGNYPYLQGLWALPMGIGIPLAGVTNLQDRPSGTWFVAIVGACVVVCAVACVGIARYYRDNYGKVTPTRSRQIRHAAAVVAWVATLFVGANKYLLWSPDGPLCVYASAFAAAMLVYYAILVGLRRHHVVIWGAVLAAGLLPIWGGLGADRDALGMIPLGVALIASGLLDQRLLARSFGHPTGPKLGAGHVAR
ncbi:MAG: hypothetical protein QOH12_2111 [Solirubrobacteraceae bacterium]|jgi:hypothetical protein|nr:hypothetical protein [Solirubrobacteraceae bacterium]